MYHSKHGAHGGLPRRDVLARIQAVLNIAVLSANPPWSEDASGHDVCTIDNAEVIAWPIDVERGTIAKASGAIVNILSGGYRLNHGFLVQPPDGVNVPLTSMGLDDAELYEGLWRYFARKSDEVERTRLAIRWLSKAWVNTTAIDWGDRIVFLKTGFEALLGSEAASSKHKASEALRTLFERAYTGMTSRELEGLAWHPTETAKYRWRDPRWKPTKPKVAVTPLQHWFLDFSEQRNQLIHEGKPCSLYYSRRNGYQGPHFFTASRVLLEAIKTIVGEHAGKHLALPPWERNMRETFEKLGRALLVMPSEAEG